MIPDFELLEEIENQLQPESQQADCIPFDLCSFIHYRNFSMRYTLHYNALVIDDFVISAMKCLQILCVGSLTLDWQGWMRLLSVWISSREQKRTLLFSLTTQQKNFAICLRYYWLTQWFWGFFFSRGKKYDRLNIVLLTDLNIKASSDQLDIIIENLKKDDITLQFL